MLARRDLMADWVRSNIESHKPAPGPKLHFICNRLVIYELFDDATCKSNRRRKFFKQNDRNSEKIFFNYENKANSGVEKKKTTRIVSLRCCVIHKKFLSSRNFCFHVTESLNENFLDSLQDEKKENGIDDADESALKDTVNQDPKPNFPAYPNGEKII